MIKPKVKNPTKKSGNEVSGVPTKEIKTSRQVREQQIKSLWEQNKNIEHPYLRLLQKRTRMHSEIAEAGLKAVNFNYDEHRKENLKSDKLIASQLASSQKSLMSAARKIPRVHKSEILKIRKHSSTLMKSSPQSNSWAFVCSAEDSSTIQNIPHGTAENWAQFEYDEPGENKIKTKIRAESPSFSGFQTIRHEFDFVFIPGGNGFGRISGSLYPNGISSIRSRNVCTYFEPQSIAAAKISTYMNIWSLNQTFSPYKITLFERQVGDGGAHAQHIYETVGIDYPALIPYSPSSPVIITVGVEFEFLSWNGGSVEFDFGSQGNFYLDFPFVTINRFE